MANTSVMLYLSCMGEAKRRRIRWLEHLRTHPLCVYCGLPATAFDHCPPRSFFQARQWPETYEFSACNFCNASSRLDEQALAALIRVRLTKTGEISDQVECEKLMQGVKNNQPLVVAEWNNISRNEIRRGLRLAFGDEGDKRRQEGWGLINMGVITKEIINRFMMKLGKALYYRHNNHVLDGVLRVYHIDLISRDSDRNYIGKILKMAPEYPIIERNKKLLVDQFIYRFNHSPEHGAMHAVVQFGEQFIFQIIAVNRQMDSDLVKISNQNGTELPAGIRHECFLPTVPNNSE